MKRAIVVTLTATILVAAALPAAAGPRLESSQLTAKPGLRTQPPAPKGRVDAGAVLYKKVGCYQCHSNEAQGGLSGPRIGPDLFAFARFSQYVRNPAGDMPPYTSKVLSDQDVADIYAWVQARPRPPAVSTIPQLAP